MAGYFCLSIRPLDVAFHGRRGSQPEWPPSPLRAFQALVAAAARRAGGQVLAPAAVEALTWLESQLPPTIIAPVASEGNAFTISVPSNSMDIIANAWTRGNESNSGDANPATHRTMKQVRSMWMPDGAAVHYLWSLGNLADDKSMRCQGVLSEFARSIVAVGWGIDMAVGHARAISDTDLTALTGERWIPLGSIADGSGLRVPRSGSLANMIQRHQSFLARLQTDQTGQTTLIPPVPLSVFSTIEYRTATEPEQLRYAAFSLARIYGEGLCAFNPVRRALSIAGMVRHATEMRAKSAGWSASKIASFVLGHGEPNGERHISVGPGRFAYLPLPSIEIRGNLRSRQGPIRRVLLAVPARGCEHEIEWARRSLSGQELIDSRTNRAIAMLTSVPATDSVVRRYVLPAATWATVTPVVLPGFDDPAHYRRRLKRGVVAKRQREMLDRLQRRTDGLIRQAIIQAGIPEKLAATAQLEWNKVSFWPGGDRADDYGVPDHLMKFPRLHLKIRWRTEGNFPLKIPGPLCIGGGRFYGLGLFASL